MEVTPEQKVILNNFNTHLANLKNELRVISEQLAETLRLKEITSKELGEFSSTLSKLRLESIEINKNISERTNAVQRKEVYVENREQKLQSDIKKFEETKGLEKIESDRYKEFVESKIRELIEKKNNLEAELKSTEKELVEVEESLVKDKKESKELEKIKNRLNSEILHTQQEIEKIESKLSAKKKEFETEVQKLGALVATEKEKISKPMELIAEENRKLDKKRMNLEILYQRFRREFKKLHPEQEPVI